jgi:hypothetical protein
VEAEDEDDCAWEDSLEDGRAAGGTPKGFVDGVVGGVVRR